MQLIEVLLIINAKINLIMDCIAGAAMMCVQFFASRVICTHTCKNTT